MTGVQTCALPISLGQVKRTGARPLAVAALSWASIAALSLGAVYLATAAGVPALG